jgi:hypothetical protein
VRENRLGRKLFNSTPHAFRYAPKKTDSEICGQAGTGTLLEVVNHPPLF